MKMLMDILYMQAIYAWIKLKAFFQDYETPLHVATRRGHEKIIALLIAMGADLKAKNKVYLYYDRYKRYYLSILFCIFNVLKL